MSNEKEMIDRNIELSAEFSRYLFEHPEIEGKIPVDAEIILLPEFDKELKAFAKAYVEFHKIRSAYENSLDDVRDRQEETKAQHEALIKIDKALEKQRLKPDAYYRIFKAVNADEKLRAKTMKLIEEERRAAS